MTGVYMITNSVTGRKYIGSSHNVEYRMHTHLLLLRRGKHSVEDMQEDFDRYGEESFVFFPLFEKANKGKDYEKSDLEHFLKDVLRTHDRKYGYNYKDNAGTAKYLTRESRRHIRKAYWLARFDPVESAKARLAYK